MNVSVPINSVSFGYCSTCILLELFQRKTEINLFPIGPVDLTSYPAAKRTTGFEEWLKQSIFYAHEKYSRAVKTFKLWHIKDSEQGYGDKRNLFTFHELNSITRLEKNILNNQDTIFVTNKYAKSVMEGNGVKPEIVVAPLGFDARHFKKIDKRTYADDRITFGLFGKLESARKRHTKIIQNWIKKFGNDRRYQLHLHVTNPHLTPEQNNSLLSQIIGNKPFNVNVLPYVQDLDIYNRCINAVDIVMDAGTEGWSLPSFHSVALGKHAVLLNFAGLAEWGNSNNSVQVEVDSMIEPYDNIFFHKGGNCNQGLIADFRDDEFIFACETSISRFLANPVNFAGLELQEKFTWGRAVDTILANLK